MGELFPVNNLPAQMLFDGVDFSGEFGTQFVIEVLGDWGALGVRGIDSSQPSTHLFSG